MQSAGHPILAAPDIGCRQIPPRRSGQRLVGAREIARAQPVKPSSARSRPQSLNSAAAGTLAVEDCEPVLAESHAFPSASSPAFAAAADIRLTMLSPTAGMAAVR